MSRTDLSLATQWSTFLAGLLVNLDEKEDNLIFRTDASLSA